MLTNYFKQSSWKYFKNTIGAAKLPRTMEKYLTILKIRNNMLLTNPYIFKLGLSQVWFATYIITDQIFKIIMEGCSLKI